MLRELKNWFSEKRENLSVETCEMELVLADELSGETVGYIDFVTIHRMARATVWDTGECDLEVLDINTGKQQFYETVECETTQELRSKLESFYQQIGCK